MTARALDLVVPSLQRELRLFIVVVGAVVLETLRGVAGRAVLSETTLVVVVDSMAIDARRRHSPVLFIWMTASAGNLRMLACEWVLGLRVIELRSTPSCLAVAVSTLLAKPTVMSILFPVAATAAAGRVAAPGLSVGRMTVFTGCRAMGPEQGIVGRIVVEPIRVQTRDVMVPALVLRVAGATGQLRSASIASVKTLTRASVCCDILMAEHAQCRLAPGSERAVAFAAVVLDLCMQSCDGPGHQQPLEVDRSGFAHEQHGSEYYCERHASPCRFRHQYKLTAKMWIAAAVKRRTHNGRWSACQSENNHA